MILMIGIGGRRKDIGGIEGKKVVMRCVVVLRIVVRWWWVGMVK